MKCFAPVSLLIFLCIFVQIGVHAQLEVHPSIAITVRYPSGEIMPNPWSGGINAAQISMFDADNDGQMDDIFLFDRSGHRPLVFNGIMINGERQYIFNPSYSAQFPAMRHWALLRDYNCDGNQDIFTQSPVGGGFAVYQNTTQSSDNILSFELENIQLQTSYIFQNSTSILNLYTSPLDIPGIIDADGDGDLDIFTFSVTGTRMEYHENLSVDNTEICGIEHFRAANLCYGQFTEGSESNEITLGQPCNFNVLNPRSGDENEGLRHVGTTILAHDLNDDAVIDIVLGGVTFNNATFLENSVGDNGVDSIATYQSDFPAAFGGPAINLDNFVGNFYEDITGNGVKDLVVSVNEPFLARNTSSIWLYENLGTNAAPIFSIIKTDFLQEGTIDLGEVAAPVFADINGDGLQDMVIGSRGEFLQATSFKPILALYLNIGTQGQPEFLLADSDWLQVSAIGFDQYVHPSFGDIDGDGDLDLVIGDLSGKVYLLLNTASTGNPMSFELAGAIGADEGVIDVGQQSTPQLFDLDQDGKADLIIGERNGNINYYRNTGSLGNYSFQFETDTLGNVDTVEPGYFIGNAAPHFFRHEGITYLLIGVERGRLHLYSGIDGNEDGTYTLESLDAFGVDAGEKSRPFVIDINSDGMPEIFCGSVGGGILYFAGGQTVVSTASSFNEQLELHLYPNPGSTKLNALPSRSISNAQFSIYSLSGKLVMQGYLQNESINTSPLAKGAYIVVIFNEQHAERGLWMKQ